MRQAGRYLPEYRTVRSKAGSFLGLCYNPRLAAEVTLQPLHRYDLDAAIVFADILVVPHAMGVGLEFREGEGPALEKVDAEERVARLQPVMMSDQVKAVCETLQRVRGGLPSGVALIGFCGAPWTVASYMVGGGASNGRDSARLAAIGRQPWFGRLIERLVEESVEYLSLQIDAGAEAVQIFDSWAGELPWDVAETWVLAPIASIVSGLRRRHPSVPIIVFARGAGAGHERVAIETGAQAVGIEAGVPLRWARQALMPHAAVQGNLEPLALLAGTDALERSVSVIVSEMPKARHVFNLGHGIRPETDPAALSHVLRRIREHDGDG